MQEFRGEYKQHPREFSQALTALETTLVEAQAIQQELKALEAVVRSKGAFTWHRLKRWFVVNTLPSDIIFMHHVQSAESPASYRESAITFFESVHGVTKKIAQAGIAAILNKQPLTYQQRLLLRKVYAAWRESLDEKLEKNPTMQDLQLLVSIRNHENPEVRDLFRIPQSRAAIFQVFTTKKDVSVPSKAIRKLLDQIPHRDLYDKLKDGKRLLNFYQDKLGQAEGRL